MWFMIIPGVIAVGFGFIFLCAPQRLVWGQSAPVRAAIPTDSWLLKYHISTGLCLIAAGVFCLASAFYVWLRVHP